MNHTTKLLAQLDVALAMYRNASPSVRRHRFNDLYTAYVRFHRAVRALDDGEWTHEPPAWEKFPIARDFYTQGDMRGA